MISQNISKIHPYYFIRDICTNEDSNDLFIDSLFAKEFDSFDFINEKKNSNNEEDNTINTQKLYFNQNEENKSNKNYLIHINNNPNKFNISSNKSKNDQRYINKIRRKIIFITKKVESKKDIKKIKFKPKKNKTSTNKKRINRHDHIKIKVFNKCFQNIGVIIKSICNTLYPQDKFHKLNKRLSSSSNNLEMEKFCKKTIEEIMREDCLISINSIKSNKSIIEKIFEMKMSEADKVKVELINKILKGMTFGNILKNYLDDINFVKDIDINNNDFTTFSDDFSELSDKRKRALIYDYKTNIIKN